MNKQDFFTIIREGLNDFPEEELNDILKEYEDYFNTNISQGKTDEEIINNLDNPFMIVNKYRNNYLPSEDKLIKSNEKADENFIDPSDATDSSSNSAKFSKSSYNSNSTSTKPENNNNLILKIIITALILVLFGPFLIATFGVLIGLLISLIAIPFSLLIGGSGLLISRLGISIVGFTAPSFLMDFPISVAFLVTLGSFFATVLLIIISYYCIKFIILFIKKLFSKSPAREAK